VIEMTSDFHVPAEGEVPYQDFFVKVPFEGDRWAEAIEARPGNPAAVHHNRISFRDFPLGVTPTDGAESRLTLPARPRAEGNGVPRGVPNYLAAYAPGHGIDVFEPGIGRRLHGGPNTYVQFNNHYQPTGKPEVDQSSVRIHFVKQLPGKAAGSPAMASVSGNNCMNSRCFICWRSVSAVLIFRTSGIGQYRSLTSTSPTDKPLGSCEHALSRLDCAARLNPMSSMEQDSGTHRAAFERRVLPA
jgi:hypothetical protein